MSERANKKKFRIFKILVNKYTLAVAIFYAFLIFFDDHNLLTKWKLRKENKQLEKELIYYKDEIKQNKILIKRLKTDSVYLEKYAREKYYLKNENEDVFIIKDKKEETKK